MSMDWKDNEYILRPVTTREYNRSWDNGSANAFIDEKTIKSNRFGVSFEGINEKARGVVVNYDLREMQLLSVWYGMRSDYYKWEINQFTFIAKLNHSTDVFPSPLIDTLGAICWEGCNDKALKKCLEKIQVKLAIELANKKINWDENTKKFVDFLNVYLDSTDVERENDFIVLIEPIMFWENKYTKAMRNEPFTEDYYIKLENFISLYGIDLCMDAYAIALMPTEYEKYDSPITSCYGFYNTNVIDDTEENLKKVMTRGGKYYYDFLEGITGKNPPSEFSLKGSNCPLYVGPLYCNVMVEFEYNELYKCMLESVKS